MFKPENVGPVPTYCEAIRREPRNLNPIADLDLLPFELEIGTPVTPALHYGHADFGLSFYSLFSQEPVRDRRIDGRARPVLRPIRTPLQFSS